MTEQGRKLRMCQAELAQERRLTEHLNAVNQNLVEKNGNQFTQIKGLQDAVNAEVSLNGRLQNQIVKLSREHDINLKTISEMRDKSISATIEANVTNEMVAKIVNAMEGAGYPIAGHATKEQFDKLAKQVEQAEGYAVNSQIEVEETNNFLANAISMIDEIREERES